MTRAAEKAESKAAVKKEKLSALPSVRVVRGTKAFHERLGDSVDVGVPGAKWGTLEERFRVVAGSEVRVSLTDSQAEALELIGLETEVPKFKE